jgi:NAD-specific glutamate dehydrogenase
MAAELVDRLALLVAVRRFLGMGADDPRSLRFDSYVRMQNFVRQTSYVPFRRFWGDLRRELMQRLFADLHGTRGSFLRDALHECSVDVVACLHVPRAKVFSSFPLFAEWP